MSASPFSPEETCVFCRIIAGTEPAEIVNESEVAVTFVPLNPVTEGHVLVVPRQHARYIWEMEPKHLGYTMYDVASHANYLRVIETACNIIQSNGEVATQSIGHVHFHIVPRRPNDGLALPWTGRPREVPTRSDFGGFSD